MNDKWWRDSLVMSWLFYSFPAFLLGMNIYYEHWRYAIAFGLILTPWTILNLYVTYQYLKGMNRPWNRQDCTQWKWLHFWSDIYKFKWKLIHLKRRFLPVKVIEAYEGRVSLFEDGIGYVTLKEMSTGQDFIAECPEFRLKKHGILTERMGFTLRLIEISHEVCKMEYEPLPLIRISKEEQDQIRREVEEAFEDWDLEVEGDY